MKKHILVVDDSSTIRASVCACLRNAGYKITEAVNGKDALEKLRLLQERNQALSLILTDLNMPEMDGITLVRKVREGVFKFVPILVLTTEAHESVIEAGISAGASGWLQKPFDPEQLLRSIKKLVWSK